MKNQILLLLITFFLTSCNQEKIIELENTISKLERRIAYLEQFEPDLSIPQFSNEEVIGLLKK